jgi:hypothetical protein
MDSGLMVKVLHEGGKHAAVRVSGFLSGDTEMTLISVGDLSHQPRSLRIDTIHYAIQEKAGIHLLWAMKGTKEPELILTLESRGKFDFSEFGGLTAPKDWEGKLILRAFNVDKPKAVFFVLQMEKQ